MQMRKQTVDIIRMWLLKTAARAVHPAGYIAFGMNPSPFLHRSCQLLSRSSMVLRSHKQRGDSDAERNQIPMKNGIEVCPFQTLLIT